MKNVCPCFYILFLSFSGTNIGNNYLKKKKRCHERKAITAVIIVAIIKLIGMIMTTEINLFLFKKKKK